MRQPRKVARVQRCECLLRRLGCACLLLELRDRVHVSEVNHLQLQRGLAPQARVVREHQARPEEAVLALRPEQPSQLLCKLQRSVPSCRGPEERVDHIWQL
eukprot:SAG22_NODE_940_length_6402_cov_34.673172_4_plen_101_part_00